MERARTLPGADWQLLQQEAASELLAEKLPVSCVELDVTRGVSHDESEFTHRPAAGVRRERQYVLPNKQHRLRHQTEFPIFGCTTRAILESTSLGIW